MQGNPEKPFNNAEGYADLTAYTAEKNIEKEENETKARISAAIKAARYIVKLFGFEIKGRIVIVDSTTGREYR